MLADFRSYVEAQARIDRCYRNQDAWVKAAIANIANMGYFSSDRSIEDYAKNIWHIKPLPEVGAITGNAQDDNKPAAVEEETPGAAAAKKPKHKKH